MGIAAGLDGGAELLQVAGYVLLRIVGAERLKLLPNALRAGVRVGSPAAHDRQAFVALLRAGLPAQVAQVLLLRLGRAGPEHMASGVPGLVRLPLVERGGRLPGVLGFKASC